MDRREMVGWLSSFAASGALGKLPGGERLRIADELHRLGGAGRVLSARQNTIVATLAEAILPRTDTPGAADVGVPQFIDHLLAAWYSERERADFLAGIDALDALARQRFGKGVAALADADRTSLLAELDGKPKGQTGSAEDGFSKVKSLTIYGYFTSKQVQTEVLANAIIPGRFDGCIPIPAR